ncbi:YfhO family protein, partial [Patescibacteria group bacterium]|nr:YfhO family protein [Patescibacteria group bacterium]
KAIIGLGISFRAFAPQYIHTTTVSKRAVAAENQEERKSFAASWSLHPEEVASLILPEFAGFDLGNQGQHYWGRNSFKINSEYFGVLIMLFAIGALFMFKKKGIIQCSVLLFLFALLYSLGNHTPLFSLGYHFIPGMKVVRGLAFLSLLFSFAAMYLAGFGLNQFFDPEERKHIQWSKWNWIVGAFLAVGFFCAILTGPLMGLWQSIMYGGLEGQKAQAMIANQNEIKIGGLVLILITGIMLTLLYAYRSGKISSTVFGISLLLIIVFDSWRIDKQFLEWIPLDRVTTPSDVKIPPYEYLKEHDKSLYRILPYDFNPRFTYSNVNLVTGFNDFTVLEYNNVVTQLNLPLLNLLSCKYVISRGEQKIQGFPQIYSQNGWYIYQNPYSYPYIYFASQWQVETDKDRVFKLIASSSQDFTRVPVIEKEPPSGFASSQSALQDSIGGAVELLNQAEYYQGKLSENIFQVKQPSAGLLVISENYHPDWHGYIDGKETPVYKVNYLWRGIFVPAGEHKVEFRFQPRVIMVARTISTLFMLGYLIAIGVMIVKPMIRPR